MSDDKKEPLPERMASEVSATFRPSNLGAEMWLNRPIPLLDHGFVYLVDYAGDDSAIVQAARVSYGRGTKKASDDRGLIRYLMRHRHTTPFEMVEFKFHCKMPIFVARQWVRHRMASINEYSGRYSVMSSEFYLPAPEALAKQAEGNRQGREGELSPLKKKRVLEILANDYSKSYDHYEEFLETGVTRELARIGLSVANYTEWYWKIDLHNLFHFLSLRADAHAQYEIRVYAEALARIVKDAMPLAYEAFEDYRMKAMQLSRLEVELVTKHRWPKSEDVAQKLILALMKNKRETAECVAKLKRLKLVK